MRIVFMGTPDFSVPVLTAIHSRYEIVGVYTQEDKPVGRGLEIRLTPVKQKARELGLTIFQPKKLSQPGEFERLSELKPDAIVVVAYGQILKKNVLDLPKLGCINIHSSLLPRWRGAAPIQAAILAGDPISGVTTMFMAEKLDAGDILLQSETKLKPDETAGSLHDRLSQMGAELILKTLEDLGAGRAKPIRQDESKVTYASKLNKEMEGLNPELDSEQMDRNIRALNPWPGTSVWVEEPAQRLKIKQAKAMHGLSGMQGKIYEKAGMLLLGCAQGSLELQRIQWEGKREIDSSSFLNGLKGSGKTLPLNYSKSPSSQGI